MKGHEVYITDGYVLAHVNKNVGSIYHISMLVVWLTCAMWHIYLFSHICKWKNDSGHIYVWTYYWLNRLKRIEWEIVGRENAWLLLRSPRTELFEWVECVWKMILKCPFVSDTVDAALHIHLFRSPKMQRSSSWQSFTHKLILKWPFFSDCWEETFIIQVCWETEFFW